MKNKNGFSLTEILISLVIATILALSVGKISEIANQSHSAIRKQTDLFNDLAYALNLFDSRIRTASSLASGAVNNPWNQAPLEINNTAIGVQANGLTRSLVYVPDKDAPSSNVETIFSIDNVNAGESLNFSFSCSPSCTLAHTVSITISGTKENIPFNISSTSRRRLI